jgi:hypothetical protein
MNFSDVESIANAVLFEGYILYPYRPSAIKNRQRWNFGTLYPRTFADAQRPRERSSFSTQVLVESDDATRIWARVRFLHLYSPANAQDGWKQGCVRSRTLAALTPNALLGGVESRFDFSDLSADEQDSVPPDVVGCPLVGHLTLAATQIRAGLIKLRGCFENLSPTSGESVSREATQDVACTSAHLLLGVEHGQFVSMLDPPKEYEVEASCCSQDGVYPVLAGKEGALTQMLCSPIILYDYPQVAPESAGDFFDGTEMDEMLALRVLTLTDEEKAAMRTGDPRARAILERTEALPHEQLLKVHGAVRGLRSIEEESHLQINVTEKDVANPFMERPPIESVRAFGVELHKGDRVRLWPQKKADILDMAMEGKVAIIEAIEQDLEDNVHLAVVLEDDPGRDMGMLRQAGHRFFYSLDEVEPLLEEAL